MGKRFVNDKLKAKPYLSFTQLWPNEHVGRWCKRQLSKARRRYARALLNGDRHPRSSVYWECECNWKTW